jgi:hypothetical protein
LVFHYQQWIGPRCKDFGHGNQKKRVPLNIYWLKFGVLPNAKCYFS